MYYSGGLYHPWYNPYGIHLEPIWNSIWNPWNQCWLRPQPIHCSMDIMDSMWNGHGMVNSIWNPSLFHMDSLDSIWNVGISTMDSMDKSIWIPWNSPYGFHGTGPYSFHGTSSYGFHGINPYGINDHYTIRIHINSTRNY